jgi:hypothetical protein
VPLGAWVDGGVCFGLGTNCPCRIYPRLPATTDLLALAGTRRWEVQKRECRRCISSAGSSGSAESLSRSGSSRLGQIRSQNSEPTEAECFTQRTSTDTHPPRKARGVKQLKVSEPVFPYPILVFFWLLAFLAWWLTTHHPPAAAAQLQLHRRESAGNCGLRLAQCAVRGAQSGKRQQPTTNSNQQQQPTTTTTANNQQPTTNNQHPTSRGPRPFLLPPPPPGGAGGSYWAICWLFYVQVLFIRHSGPRPSFISASR